MLSPRGWPDKLAWSLPSPHTGCKDNESIRFQPNPAILATTLGRYLLGSSADNRHCDGDDDSVALLGAIVPGTCTSKLQKRIPGFDRYSIVDVTMRPTSLNVSVDMPVVSCRLSLSNHGYIKICRVWFGRSILSINNYSIHSSPSLSRCLFLCFCRSLDRLQVPQSLLELH